MFIDVHCHLTGGEYEGVGGVEAVLSRARDAGVTAFVSSGFDLASSRAAAELSGAARLHQAATGIQGDDPRPKEKDKHEVSVLFQRGVRLPFLRLYLQSLEGEGTSQSRKMCRMILELIYSHILKIL